MVNNLTLKLLRERLAAVECCVSSDLSLALFIDLLVKWNRKINLTSLDIEPLTAEAIDRLIVEPVIAASHVENKESVVVDLGSGGGSPAIPFRIQLPLSRMTMVESRSKKCAFLREAIRTIGLDRTSVEESRFELLQGSSRFKWSADLITVRAVRLDKDLVELIKFILAPGGQVFRFVGGGETEFHPELRLVSLIELVPSRSSGLQILTLH